jgi:hypothetical protein
MTLVLIAFLFQVVAPLLALMLADGSLLVTQVGLRL